MFGGLQGVRINIPGLPRKFIRQGGLLLLLLLLTLALGPLLDDSPLHALFSPEGLHVWRIHWGDSPLAWVVYGLGGSLAATVGFPLTLIIVGAGIIFGVAKGILLSFLLALLSALMGYALGGWQGRALADRLLTGRHSALRARLDAHAFLAVFAMRFLIPFGVSNLIAGALRLPLAWYTAATVMGVSPWILALVLVSADLTDSTVLGWRLSLIGLVLLALGILTRYLQRYLQSVRQH